MKISAVLFDLDDTLHDKSATLRSVASIQYKFTRLQEAGLFEVEWIDEFVRLNNLRIEKTEVFRLLQQRFSLSVEVATKLLQDFDNNLGKLAMPYEGAISLVEACKAHGLKVGIVTNGRDAFQRSKIDGLGLTKLVDFVVTSGGFGIKKPDPQIFQSCLEGLSVNPNQAAFIGDDFKADMEPSLELGMIAIWKSASKSQRARTYVFQQ